MPELDEVQKDSFDSLCSNHSLSLSGNEGVPELDEVQKASFDSLCSNHSL